MRSFILLISMALFCCAIERDSCEFGGGEMILTVLGNVQGQIVGVYRNASGQCRGAYDVRFLANESVTDSRILSGDGPIAGRPFQKVKMYNYELKKVEQ